MGTAVVISITHWFLDSIVLIIGACIELRQLTKSERWTKLSPSPPGIQSWQSRRSYGSEAFKKPYPLLTSGLGWIFWRWILCMELSNGIRRSLAAR